MRRALIWAVFVAGACGGSADSTSTTRPAVGALPPGNDAAIQRHIDGDTIGVAAGRSVRLIGIDTPETRDPRQPVECFGREASEFIAELLPVGTEVRLVSDLERRDRYDRTLAYVYRFEDGLFVNAELVRAGYAQVATFPPNVAHVEDFLALQREARAERRGLWRSCEGTAQTT